MQDILVLGAGKIGALISGLLAESGDYRVQLADSMSGVAADVVSAHNNKQIVAFDLDASNKEALTSHVREHKPSAIVSGLPYHCNVAVAEVARSEGLHYFDLTEDVAVTAAVRELAKGAKQVFAPQCGLAPGFISIAANELIQHFESLKSVKLRVGALPQHPNNVLKYSLTWSTDGVINEYGNLCQSIVDGEEIDVLPLEGLEKIEIDGTRYEAFNTSGGLGSLGETYGDRVTTMNYKTIRYPGHCEQMRLLMNGLKAESRSADAQTDTRECRSADLAGCRRDLCGGNWPAGRRVARRKLREQDLPAGCRRASVVRHSDYDGIGNLLGAGHCFVQPRQLRGIYRAGTIPVDGRP